MTAASSPAHFSSFPLLLTSVPACFKNVKPNGVLHVLLPSAGKLGVILKHMEGCLVTAASLAVREELAFIFIFATARQSGQCKGEMNENQVSLWGLRSCKTDVGGNM